MGPLRYYTLIFGSVAALAAGAGYWLTGRRRTPEQRERERRQRLAIHGRITDATLTDVCELPAGGNGSKSVTRDEPVQLLIFNYDVAGVTYEASQDVTHMQQYVDPAKCRLGKPAWVKYDPQNPGNSIVIAEEWTGLRN